MKVKVGFRIGDRVTYNVRGEKIRAEILAVYNPDQPLLTEYEIRVTANSGKAYRKGDTFRTTGNWLSLSSRPITPEVKATRERKAAERKAAQALKDMAVRFAR